MLEDFVAPRKATLTEGSLAASILQGSKLWWRLASQGNGPFWQRNPPLESRPHPVGEMEGRPAPSCQLVQNLLDE